MQAIINACRQGDLKAETSVVISNNSGSGAIKRAKREGIPYRHLSNVTHPQPEELDRAIKEALEEYETNLVILSGYMKMLGPQTLTRYYCRILNVHPALLPKFGGNGMYGGLVHEAVLGAGERVSGVTIHIVDEEYDHGPIVAQCKVPVLDSDTVGSLMKRVQAREREFFVETLQRISRGHIKLS